MKKMISRRSFLAAAGVSAAALDVYKRQVPGKAPVMPFRKFESVYDSDAYPEDVRYESVALEELTTRFRISFNYQLEQMPDNAQRDVILEIIHKHKDYLRVSIAVVNRLDVYKRQDHISAARRESSG